MTGVALLTHSWLSRTSFSLQADPTKSHTLTVAVNEFSSPHQTERIQRGNLRRLPLEPENRRQLTPQVGCGAANHVPRRNSTLPKPISQRCCVHLLPCPRVECPSFRRMCNSRGVTSHASKNNAHQHLPFLLERSWPLQHLADSQHTQLPAECTHLLKATSERFLRCC